MSGSPLVRSGIWLRLSLTAHLFCCGAQAAVSDSTGLQIGAAADLLGNFQFSTSNFEVREVELFLAAPADHLLDANLGLAAHQESGQAVFEIHEAWVMLGRSIPQLKIKAGQYFLGLGRLNQFHRHDWPFSSTPIVQENFLGEEGISDSGIELSWLTPLPVFLELTGGVTSGWKFGHSHSAGSFPKVPTHYLRASTFLDLPGAGGLLFGVNYLGRLSAFSERTILVGGDLTLKWTSGKHVAWQFQTEGWLRNSGTPASMEREFGGYFWAEHGFGSGLSLGFRADYLTNLTTVESGTSNWEEAYGPTLTYRPSEFSKFRLSYQYRRSVLGSAITPTHEIAAQTVFVLGSHPAHSF